MMLHIENIKLDYDTKNFNDIFSNNFKNKAIYIINTFKLKVYDLKVYETKQGHHIYIDVCNKLSNEDLVFFQLLLGSDYVRECWYWKQIKYTSLKHREWNVLFSKKEYSLKSQRRGKKPSIEKFSNPKTARLLNYISKIYETDKWRKK
jgi:hypothetical protein